MARRLLLGALVVTVLAVVAVFTVAASPSHARAGFAIGLAQVDRPAPAQFDELMDPEFGCGGSGHHEYIDPG